jgi:hypothetical protein
MKTGQYKLVFTVRRAQPAASAQHHPRRRHGASSSPAAARRRRAHALASRYGARR